MNTPSDVVPEEPRPPAPRRLPLGYGISAVFAAFILASLFGELAKNVAQAVTGGTAAHGGEGLSAAVVVPTMLASQLALLLVALVTPLLASASVRDALDLEPGPHGPLVFVAAAVGTIMLGPLGDALMTLFARVFPGVTLGVVPALHELASRLPLFVLWPTFALSPGVVEELLFRGVFQGSFRRGLLAVVLTGIAFACFHFDPVHVAGVLPLGLFLSWVAYRTNTLVTIFAHVTNNSVAVLSIHSAVLDVGYGTGREVPLSWVAGSLVVFAAAALVIARETRGNQRAC